MAVRPLQVLQHCEMFRGHGGFDAVLRELEV
jgi:hypothetical protein